MRNTFCRAITLFATMFAGVLLLSACAGGEDSDSASNSPSESIAISTIERATDETLDFELPDADEPAAHVDFETDPTTVTVVTWGSSSCPAYPTSITWSDATTLAIATSSDYGVEACTNDLVANGAVVEVPPNQDGLEIEAITLDGEEIDFTTSSDQSH